MAELLPLKVYPFTLIVNQLLLLGRLQLLVEKVKYLEKRNG